jgi:hypothetical protein
MPEPTVFPSFVPTEAVAEIAGINNVELSKAFDRVQQDIALLRGLGEMEHHIAASGHAAMQPEKSRQRIAGIEMMLDFNERMAQFLHLSLRERGCVRPSPVPLAEAISAPQETH